ncbi:radical SAM protein [Deltaproteobacteria bacterium OttesenSCG-928-M10]|nr:radical SAM protein [Deltaproteobacteria bacterium OttesenSCG-928-M10]
MLPDRILDSTESLCPQCLAVLPAEIKKRGAEIFLCRRCPEHGLFEEVIWRGDPDFESWRRPKEPVKDLSRQTATDKGCPFDCGRCPDHGQHSCTVLLEITGRCNLRCPICFADSGRASEASSVDLPETLDHMAWIREQAGEVVLQLSGGEPTLHPHLVDLVRAGAKIFPAVQLNTNGLKLAEDPALAQKLAEAGLAWVFLQFDGISGRSFEIMRGRPLLAPKMAAIEACDKAGLAVVLVPTVAAGVNDHELGGLVRLALGLPIVRGVHIQPMTSAGRNSLPGAGHRLTLPEVLVKLAGQTGGLISPEHAFPPGCEHERCSFHLRYRRTDDGGLIPLSGGNNCGCKTTGKATSPEDTAEARGRAVEVILKSWKAPPSPRPLIPMAGGLKPAAEAFDDFIAKARRETFSVTCMAFQDAWTVDLARLRGCCVHVFQPPRRLVPFCAMNLTRADGRPLHRV